ncbi:MAG: hypothetical protein HZB86_11965 [Deltaproteobacteria bacterium]|nr:hypothetical protein [Deltaproteobacteria bacterium]
MTVWVAETVAAVRSPELLMVAYAVVTDQAGVTAEVDPSLQVAVAV